MIKLLVIADDFTGALDTGVQFAGKGIATKILNQRTVTREQLSSVDKEVLVIDTETRHLKPEAAYGIVYALAKMAKEAGVTYLYKKTDSGMRGNIGPELWAALEASGQPYLTFIPAFPAINRVTKNGIHYINGLPVQESVFGQDPYDPVKTSKVSELFENIPADVALYCRGETVRKGKSPEIGIFDVETNEDIGKITEALLKDKTMGVMAGCAGFASVLADHLELKKGFLFNPAVTKKLFIACGSVNGVSRKQIEYAEDKGVKRITMTPEQQFSQGYLDSEEGRRWLEGLKKICDSGQTCVLETGISDTGAVETYMQEKRIPLETARVRIADSLGNVVKNLLDMGMEATVMIIGGDTLNSFFHEIDCHEITICKELSQGTVLSSINLNRGRQWIISKSGGFGSPELLTDIEQMITG